MIPRLQTFIFARGPDKYGVSPRFLTKAILIQLQNYTDATSKKNTLLEK